MLHPTGKAPDRVAIVGGGPSKAEFFTLCNAVEGPNSFADEVWAVNTMMRAVRHDVGWMIDDPDLFGYGAPVEPFFAWLREHDRPVFCSRADSRFPSLLRYPIKDVVAKLRMDYFEKSSVPYLIAYAIALGVKMLSLWGVDYETDDKLRPEGREAGRSCVEFWCGVAHGKGMRVLVPSTSPLLGRSASDASRFYGYKVPPELGGGDAIVARAREDMTEEVA